MNKRLQDQNNSRQDENFVTDASKASLPTLQNDISKNNLPSYNHYNALANLGRNDDQNNEESNILVAVRVRPIITKESQVGDLNIIRHEDNLLVQLIVLDPVELEHETEKRPLMDVLHRSKEQRYAFDKIFRNESQDEIYNETCRGLIKPVLGGYNACVFAYGATGAGKTYTMLGYQEVPGIMVLTIRDMFETIKNMREKEYNIIISYVEIYNETIRDLLVPSSTYLELRDDPIKGVQIAGVTEHKAESTEQIMNLLFLGNKRRTTEATNANQTSSRSHAVFQITVTATPRTKNTSVETTIGKLSLIDLAGSERGTVTENRGIRLREGAKINRSLLALANCINALGDKSKKGFFVNYRDSKLTRLLKDSLGGNCKTVMIANISPASSQIEETINTLKYANRAKNIKTKVMSNKKMVSLHIAEYKNIINDLRQEIEDLKSKFHEAADYPGYQPLSNNFMKGDNQRITESGEQRDNKECPCWCGRAEDDVQMKKIQEEIFENFQQRIQLRRALMELEEQNAMNILEMRKKKAEIIVWEKNDTSNSQAQIDGKENIENGQDPEKKKRPLSALPKDIQGNYRSIQTLRISTDRNALTRDQLNQQLQDNIEEAKKIRDTIPKRIRHQDKTEYLELIIKNHVLELQNIELEIHLKIQEKIINDLKNIIHGQRKIITENKLDNQMKVPWGEDEPDILSEGELNQENQGEEDIDLDDYVYDDNPNVDKEEDSDSFEEENKHARANTTSPDKKGGKKKVEKRSPNDEERKNDSSVPMTDRFENKQSGQKGQVQSQGDLPVTKEFDDSIQGKLGKHDTNVANSYSGNTKENSTIQASKDKIKKSGGIQQGSTNNRMNNEERRGNNKSVSPMPMPPTNNIGKDGKFKANLAALNIYAAGVSKKEKEKVIKKM